MLEPGCSNSLEAGQPRGDPALRLLHAAERKRRLERWLRGKEEFRKLGLADVVIVSFGKSGRTWLRMLLSRFFQLRFGLSPSAFIGFDNLHRKNDGIPRVFFTHDNYLRDYTGNLDNRSDFYGKKVVLLVRQPADVAVSQFHQWKFRMRPHKKGLNQYPEHGREVDVFSFVMDEEAGLPKVIEFMNAWARELPNLEQILIVRYEDLRRTRPASSAGCCSSWASSRPTPSWPTASPSPASRTCASSRRRARSGSPARA